MEVRQCNAAFQRPTSIQEHPSIDQFRKSLKTEVMVTSELLDAWAKDLLLTGVQIDERGRESVPELLGARVR